MKQENAEIQLTERPGAWNRFWFSPADPTLLGLIRICCGLVTLYTMVVYSFSLQAFMGETAWHDRESRMKDIRFGYRPVDSDLNWPKPVFLEPKTPEEIEHYNAYLKEFKHAPPPPAPRNRREAEYVWQFRKEVGVDLRINGLRPPATEEEMAYLEDYTEKWQAPPPAYPRDAEERAYIDEYLRIHGVDPRMVYATSSPLWSLWFDVTDPTSMAFIHGLVVLTVFLFTIGFCTRLTSILTWIFTLWYIHRNTAVLFGVDTMQTILLLYLMIGPSGAALSVDRLISRWWSRNKPRLVNRWRTLWGKPELPPEQIKPAAYTPRPEPSVSANVAYRLIQIHICIIYLIAGLAKLLGHAWWNGTAVGYTLTNFEFAPMQVGMYMAVLKLLTQVQWVWAIFVTAAGIFTLAFEISYAFLIWRERTRWWCLSGAILLHGFIGLFMGLKTFSLMMLVMNMAFLKDKEVYWFMGLFGGKGKPATPMKVPGETVAHEAPAASSAPVASTAIRENVTAKVKRK